VSSSARGGWPAFCTPGSSVSKPFLQVKDVRYRYGESSWELNIPRFSVTAREIVAILGPNSSGKSTLLRIAAGILRPRRGEVILEGSEIGRMDRRWIARRLGYLPQNVASQFDYTVGEVVRMGRYPHLSGLGTLGDSDLEAVDRSLHRTATEAFRERRLSHLSGGERQRVFLASVLAQEPRVLLLDEPASSLDIHHQARLFLLLQDLARGGMGVCVVTHDLNLASLHCDRLLLLADGHPVAEGAPSEVLREELLRSVYGPELLLERHPRSGCPVVLPAGERHEEVGA